MDVSDVRRPSISRLTQTSADFIRRLTANDVMF